MRRRRALWALPWLLAVVSLMIPMIGSGFVGWAFVVGWLVILLVIWWVRPLGGADRTAHLGAGLLAVPALVLLGTLGGLYLTPSVVAWLVLVALESNAGGVATCRCSSSRPTDSEPLRQRPHV